MTSKKGLGIKAAKHIKKGTFIFEYLGEVVDEETYRERAKTIYKNDKHFYALQLNVNQIIDSHRSGSECRFVNHSCEPNSEFQKWTVNGLPVMALFATRDIRANEEITVDYNFQPYGIPPKCECGSNECRGRIMGKSKPRAKSQLMKALNLIETTEKSKNEKEARNAAPNESMKIPNSTELNNHDDDNGNGLEIGAFYVHRRDWNIEWPPIWLAQSRKRLQKFEPFRSNDKILYRSLFTVNMIDLNL